MDRWKKLNPQPLSTAWDDFLSRFTKDGREVLMAWIWGVLDSSNSGRQAMWWYDGQGYSGKSTFIRVISSVLGRLVGACSKDSGFNQFTAASYYSKRLVVFPDCKNPMLIKQEFCHQLLGEDPMQIEYKGCTPFTATAMAKILVASNIMPQVDMNLRHESSRIIVLPVEVPKETLKKFCKVDSKGELVKDAVGKYIFMGSTTFEEELKDTIDSFLENCYSAYLQHCPSGADIVLPNSIVEEMSTLGSEESETFEELFDLTLIEDENSFVTLSDLKRDLNKVVNYNDNFWALKRNVHYVENFKSWMEKVKGIKPSKGSSKGLSTKTHYKGLRLQLKGIRVVNDI